jgi:predicted lipoprotein
MMGFVASGAGPDLLQDSSDRSSRCPLTEDVGEKVQDTAKDVQQQM